MKKTKSVKREVRQIDAAGRSIGRIATEIAGILQGKDDPSYAPHLDNGDAVEVRNAAKVKVLGSKAETKVYHRHSGYPGGIKSTQLKTVLAKDPSEAIRRAVKNMLPKNRLQKQRMLRLTVHND